jgi:hypothetical protein
MRLTDFAWIVLTVGLAACDSSGTQFQSRPQIKAIGECETRLGKTEKVIAAFLDAARFAKVEPAKMTAMKSADEVTKAARRELEELKVSGSSGFEEKRTKIDLAIGQAEKALVAAQAY